MILIRRAHGGDLSQLSELLDQYRQFYGQKSDVAAARNFLIDRIDANDAEIRVAEGEGEKLLGFCQLFPIYSTVALKRLFLLNDLYVLPEVRRAGIAKLLIAAAKDLTYETVARGVLLETHSLNFEAQALYKQMGFDLLDRSLFYFWEAK